MKRITFTIDGHSFSQDFSQDPNTDFNTEEEIIEEREKCVKEILEVTGRHCNWYKEITGFFTIPSSMKLEIMMT